MTRIFSAPVITPDHDEYRNYDGMHCRSDWQATPDSWRCPGCGRSKRAILQWGKRVSSNAATYAIGWKAGLHRRQPVFKSNEGNHMTTQAASITDAEMPQVMVNGLDEITAD